MTENIPNDENIRVLDGVSRRKARELRKIGIKTVGDARRAAKKTISAADKVGDVTATEIKEQVGGLTEYLAREYDWQKHELYVKTDRPVLTRLKPLSNDGDTRLVADAHELKDTSLPDEGEYYCVCGVEFETRGGAISHARAKETDNDAPFP